MLNKKVLLAAGIFLFVISGRAQDCMVSGGATSTTYINTTVHLKILLVQFVDVQCKKQSGSFPKYSKQNYEEMFGSDGIYVSPNRYTPDGDIVYGSMNDYFRKMSSGNVVIYATLLNHLDPDFGFPEWLTLPDTKENYNATSYWSQTLVIDAMSAASAAGINVGTLNANNKLVIIYAGNRYNGGGLNPYATTTTYIMSELENSPMDQENSTDKFARIGTHCHEFAHTLGICHSSGSRADLMEAGNRNGNWAAPAPLNPIARMRKGWLTPTTISGQQQFDMYYSLTNPQVFRINGNYGSEYFLFEVRRFDQTMTIGTTTVPDFNNTAFYPPAWSHGTITQGVFAWRVLSGGPSEYSDNGLIYACGRYGYTYPENTRSETDDGVPFPGIAGIKVLSPWSDNRNPSGTSSDPSIGTFYNLFAPNTQISTNVGMEILSENSSSITTVFYQSNPQNASPAKPQNLQLNSSYNLTLNWINNNEPDREYWEVWRAWRRSRWSQEDWTIVATTNSNSWTDPDFVNSPPNNNTVVSYKIRTKDTQGLYSIFSDIVSTNAAQIFYKEGGKQGERLSAAILPDNYGIQQNYPNPFNPKTSINYQLPKATYVKLAVYDVLGHEIAVLVNGEKPGGYYSVSFDASQLTSGVYLYRLNTGEYTKIKKMVLAK